MEQIFPRKKYFLLLIMVLALISGSSVNAQEETSATITGQVVDVTGAAIPNVTVVISNITTGDERRVQTNEEGSYNVFPLQPGTYTVTVEQSGFKKATVNVTLTARDRRPIQIALEVGASTETVTVTDEPPLIQDSPTGQALISGNQVTELPLNNRNFIRLLETVPGVSSDLSDETGFGLTSLASVSINGLRRNAVNYLVDGVSNTDVGSNITLLSAPTVDSIGEVKVLTSNYTAEIGRSGGGAVIISTRGGGNDFHGNLYEFVRNDRFNANSFFNNRAGRRTNDTLIAPVPKLRYNNFGGTFSGPVIVPGFGEGTPVFTKLKNKTFFFFSEEQRRIIRGASDVSISVPSLLERQGNFSQTLGAGLRICQNTITTNATGVQNTSFTTVANSATACPNTTTAATTTTGQFITRTDTAGQIIPAIRTTQIFRPDGIPYAGNVIPLTDIDPRSLALLQAYPLPNVGINGLQVSPLNILNTRQEVLRIDHNFNSNHRIFGRYTQDNSVTDEPFGLFNPLGAATTSPGVLPGITTSNTIVPGKVFAASYTGIFSNSLVNEATVNYSGNVIDSTLIGRGRRSEFAGANTIREIFPENNSGALPTITTRFATLGAFQGFSIEYANVTFRDNLTYTTGNHILKFGTEVTREVKNENTGGATQGNFAFSPTQTAGTAASVVGGLPAISSITGAGDSFASFLLGRAGGYTEAQTDFRVHLRFGRREFYAQDTWRIRPNITLDYGVRYQYFVPPYDRDNQIGSFDPSLYRRSAITCTTAACANFTFANSDQLNGIGLGGSTSRFGRSIIPSDKNNFSPRVGLAYSPNFENGIGKAIFGGPNKSIIRAGYGFYYDQPLVGIFEVAAFTTPAFSPNVTSTSTLNGVITFDNPTAGTPPGSFLPRGLTAIAPDFDTPESQVYSIGMQREIFKNAVIDLSYVGTKGDKLIRRRNINFLSPADTVAVGTANVGAFRPFVGYGAITYQETSARSRYNGLLSSFNYRLQKGFSITLAYTFSKTLTDSTNDRDAVDDPQNPFNTRDEYAEARTSRPHVFSASYVFEVPFFRKSSNSLLRLMLGGYQLSGITQIESGAPVARVTVADTLVGQRGLYPNYVSDPNAGLAGTIDPATGLPFIFDPTAFAAPANGTYGTSRRSFARLPGRNQTNLALSKQFYFNTERTMYIQLRAESFNLFNTTQFTGVGTTLPSAGALAAPNTLGRPTSTRLPREFQFGAKFYF